MKKTIWGNTIVKNEDRYLWFTVTSVIDYLDKLLLWDTGSTDNTKKIALLLKNKYPNKIEFKEYGEVDAENFTKARQEMLNQTKSDWLFILDGDEVWWEDSIKKVVATINESSLDFIVNPYYSVIGDIYHYQEEEAGRYYLLGRKGHLNVRALNRKIPGLHLDKPYGQEGFFDGDNKPIQERKQGVFVDAPYLHFSNIQRSNLKQADNQVMQRSRKIRHEIGKKFASGFKYPEVFFKSRPDIISDPWLSMSKSYKLRAYIETPFRELKRRLI